MSIETDFLEYWNDTFKIEAISQFRPQKELYEYLKINIPYREWLKQEHLKDYMADFAIPCKNQWVRYLTNEYDGQGWGHSGAQSSRDKQKMNQFLKMGCLTMRFDVITLKSSFEYVADEIAAQYYIIKGKEIPKKER